MNAPDAARLRELAELSQGGGCTSWLDQDGREVTGLDTYMGLADDHAEMGRLILERLDAEGYLSLEPDAQIAPDAIRVNAGSAAWSFRNLPAKPPEQN